MGGPPTSSRMARQDGDHDPYWFSHFEHAEHPPQLPCYLTHTGEPLEGDHRQSISHESALYGGAISGRGPRYCPEHRGQDRPVPRREAPPGLPRARRTRHHEMYVNGLSTSLPAGSPAGVPAVRAWAGAGRDDSTRLRHRVRLLPADTTRPHVEGQVTCPVCTLPDRSTARPATRKPPGKGSSPASTRPHHALERDPVVDRPLERPSLGFWSTTSSPRGWTSHTGSSPPGRSSGSPSGRTTRSGGCFRLADRLGLLSRKRVDAAEERLRSEEDVLAVSRETAGLPERSQPTPRGRVVNQGADSRPVLVADLASASRSCLRGLAGVVDVEAAATARGQRSSSSIRGTSSGRSASLERMDAMEEFVLPTTWTTMPAGQSPLSPGRSSTASGPAAWARRGGSRGCPRATCRTSCIEVHPARGAHEQLDFWRRARRNLLTLFRATATFVVFQWL